MKKFLLLFGFLGFSMLFSQSKYSEAQAENSSDPQVIANFVKYNPNNPKTPELKRKLYALISGNNSSVAKPKVTPLTKEKLQRQVKRDTRDGSNDRNKKTAELLTHLFSNDPNDKNAYIQIVNKSSCNLIMKISGKKYYNLTIPSHNNNFILVEKGTYSLTSSVCDAKYSSVKSVNKDIVITLDSPKIR